MSAPGALHGQRVMVVGGTSGMGLGAANAAADAGAEVIVASRRSTDSAGLRPDVRKAQVDVTDEASVRVLFESVDTLDHLFVSAAPSPGGRPGGFLEQDVAGARSYFEQKFLGSWACARYATPRMRAGSSITFLTGCSSIRPKRGMTMITATFAALEAFSQALALELGPIRVNTIRPGLIDSDMWNFLDAPARAKLLDKVRHTFPARRAGSIDDIGHAVLFLMTNPYVTGTVLEVSGGEPLIELEV